MGMKYNDKEMKTRGDFEGDKGEVGFMFPKTPNGPVTVHAKSLEEAEEKFKKIIKNKD